MRKKILSFFLVLLIPFGWIFLFNGTISIKKDNFSEKTINELNKYDLQSTLMIRQNFFMHNLSLENYAFSFGIRLAKPLHGVSIDWNDKNFWLKKFVDKSYNKDWKFEFTLIQKDQKTNNNKTLAEFNMSWRDEENYFLHFFAFIDGVKYKFTFDVSGQTLALLFMPYFNNQNSRYFDMEYLIFNFSYRSLFEKYKITEENFKSAIPKYYIDEVLQENWNLENLFKILDFVYSNTLRGIFDIGNPYEYVKFFSTTGDVGFSFFVKNGFLLYPKALYFSLRGAGHDYYFSSPIVRFYNAYKVDVKDFSYYFYSNWNTETDKLPSMYDVFSKIKMLDMDNSDKYKGFNVFEFISTKLTAGNSVEIHGFNFSIYNVKDWQNEINGGKIWQLPYLDAPWYRLDKHIINALIWAFNTLPGIKEVGKYINALGNTMNNVNLLWENISNLFAFDITFKLLLGAIISLAMFNGVMRYL